MGTVAVLTGSLWLDWAIISVSLFNAMLLLWLAFTIFLNADQRTWGVWLIEVGLALGALFFISHTAILGRTLTNPVSDGIEFWWQVGWMPVILAPFAWYVMILWYSGFWDGSYTRLRHLHYLWLSVSTLAALILLGMLILSNPLPTYNQMIRLDFSDTVTFGGIPVLFVGYPIFAAFCVALSVDLLRHPQPSKRMMGDLARQRARPWLMATSIALLAVSVLLLLLLVWVMGTRNNPRGAAITPTPIAWYSAWFDLILASLIAVAVVFLGQAIVSYEIFTGKVLPRRGFLRLWRNAIILSGGFAILFGWSIAIELASIYSLLLAMVFIILFYALISWRSFGERERFIYNLRPFVNGASSFFSGDTYSLAESLFHAICREVLATEKAYLLPLGPSKPLINSPLAYPNRKQRISVHISEKQFSPYQTNIIPLDPDRHEGFHWTIPLWSEQGIIGVLFMGLKKDNGLYTQEEIDVAQSSAERIVHMLMGEQMAQRLMQFQRQRLAETRILDLQTRRILHDDILPDVHTVILQLSGVVQHEPSVQDAIQVMTEMHQKISDLIRESTSFYPQISDERNLFASLREMVEREFVEVFDVISWSIADQPPPPLEIFVQEVVIGAVRELVRNAAIHGRGDEPIRPLSLSIDLKYGNEQEGLAITVCDDGVGMGYPFSSDETMNNNAPVGSGGGLALHSTMLAIVGGYLLFEASEHDGTQAKILLPTST